MFNGVMHYHAFPLFGYYAFVVANKTTMFVCPTASKIKRVFSNSYVFKIHLLQQYVILLTVQHVFCWSLCIPYTHLTLKFHLIASSCINQCKITSISISEFQNKKIEYCCSVIKLTRNQTFFCP